MSMPIVIITFISIQQANAMILSDDGTSCTSIGTWEPSTKTCTLKGNVTGGIEIRANEMTIDGNGYSIVGNQTSKIIQDWLYQGGSLDQVYQFASGILIDTKENITIKNLQIEGFQDGIHITDGININLSGNTIHDNLNDGLYVSDSKQVMVTNNRFIHNSYDIVNHPTDLTKHYVAIFIDRSQNYTIYQNNFSDNAGNVIVIWNGSGDSINGNTMQASNLKWSTKTGILTINSTKLTIHANYASYFNPGIELRNTDHSVVSANNLSDNNIGLMLDTTIDAQNPAVNNLIAGNEISSNSDDGIFVLASGSNTIVNNMIDDNGRLGLELSNSQENTIYNNDFVNNVKQVAGGNENLFDDAIKGGNYWSDYSPNCTDTNNDGICDKPYPFNSGTVGVVDNSAWVKEDGWKYPSQIISQPTPPIVNPQTPVSSNQTATSQNTTNTSENGTSQNSVPISQLPPPIAQSKIPAWIKNIFIWYGRGSISDDELLGAIKFLIQQGIIKVN